jgi:hypothetical protein
VYILRQTHEEADKIFTKRLLNFPDLQEFSAECQLFYLGRVRALMCWDDEKQRKKSVLSIAARF